MTLRMPADAATCQAMGLLTQIERACRAVAAHQRQPSYLASARLSVYSKSVIRRCICRMSRHRDGVSSHAHRQSGHIGADSCDRHDAISMPASTVTDSAVSGVPASLSQAGRLFDSPNAAARERRAPRRADARMTSSARNRPVCFGSHRLQRNGR